MTTMRAFVAFILISLVASTAQAAVRYVRQGAGGNGSGSDWNNAYTDLPASLTRGDTYCVADGSYKGKLFNTPNSGTAVITIRKAVHGDGNCDQGAGWVSTYGDGQASFSGDFNFSTDYYVIDGVARNASDWSQGSAYGFRFNGVATNYFSWGHASDNITIKFSNIGPDDGATNIEGYGGAVIYIGGFSETSDNWILQSNYIHNGRALGQMAGANNFLWEYNWFAKNWEKTAVRHQIRGSSMVYRYNVFKNTCQGNSFDATATSCTAILGWYGNSGSNNEDYSNSKVYGNLFWDTIGTVAYTDAAILMGDDRTSQGGGKQNCANCAAYNNSLIGMGKTYRTGDYGNCGIHFSGIKTNTEAKNNLWYGVSNLCSQGCSAATCSNNFTISNNVFVDAASGDFRLSSDGSAGSGFALASPFNLDMNGVVRGSGTWDVGAFEYKSGASDPLDTPQGLKVIVNP